MAVTSVLAKIKYSHIKFIPHFSFHFINVVFNIILYYLLNVFIVCMCEHVHKHATVYMGFSQWAVFLELVLPFHPVLKQVLSCFCHCVDCNI